MVTNVTFVTKLERQGADFFPLYRTFTMQYTFEDYQKGLCELEEVGSEIPERPSEEPLNMAALIQSAYNAVGGTVAFNAEAKKNPSALFQAVLKMGVAQAAKQETPTPPQLDNLTDADIEALDSTTLKRILLASVGISKKSEIP